MSPLARDRWLRGALWVLLLTPGCVLLASAFTGSLGANPGEALILETGQWTLRFLLLTLAATPVQRLSGWNGLLRHRRMLGVGAFAYGVLHLLAYAWLDQALVLADIVADVLDRPFIFAGMVTLLLMLPLALTSFDAAVRRLGLKRWRYLHRLVYVAAGTALLHFWWKVSMGKELVYTEVLVYGALAIALLAARALPRVRRRRAGVA